MSLFDQLFNKSPILFAFSPASSSFSIDSSIFEFKALRVATTADIAKPPINNGFFNKDAVNVCVVALATPVASVYYFIAFLTAKTATVNVPKVVTNTVTPSVASSFWLMKSVSVVSIFVLNSSILTNVGSIASA